MVRKRRHNEPSRKGEMPKQDPLGQLEQLIASLGTEGHYPPSEVVMSVLGKLTPDSPRVGSANGVYVQLMGEEPVIDGTSDYWTRQLGYRNERILELLNWVARTVGSAHMSEQSHVLADMLADFLCVLVPRGVCTLPLCGTTGTDAVESALRLAIGFVEERDGTAGKPPGEIVVLRGGFHGHSIGLDPLYVKEGGNILGHPVLRLKPGIEGAQNLPRCMEELNEVFKVSKPAIFLLETVQMSHGARVLDDDYLRRVSELCQQHGTVLIDDEVATGFGRTGKMFGFEWSGIRPGLTVVGKGITGGERALSAVLVGEEVAAALSCGKFRHGNTYSWQPGPCAAALSAIAVLMSGGYVEQAHVVGEGLRTALDSALSSFGMKIYGRGQVTGVQLPRKWRASTVVGQALKKGVRIGRGPGNTLVIAPPLTLSEDQAQVIADAVTRSIINSS